MIFNNKNRNHFIDLNRIVTALEEHPESEKVYIALDNGKEYTLFFTREVKERFFNELEKSRECKCRKEEKE